MKEGEKFDANDEPITTVSASEQIDPAYVERSGTTLVFYTTEKLAGFTGYSSSFDLAAGQVVTIVADSEVASINSLNNTTATISSIDTSPTYDAEDETNYYKITMTTASSATLVRSSDFFNLNFYRALSSTQRTLVVYPEELALNVNSPNLQGHTSYTSVSTAATGTIAAKTVTVSSNSGILDRMSVIGTGVDPYSKVVGAPSSTLVNLSKSNTAAVNSTITFASASITFYDSFAPGSSVNYYMWAGDQDPVSSSFSIVQNISNSKIVVKADAGTTPIGSINMWVAPDLPSGWILCNGSSISYSQYPELYVLLGGVSPFTATINVPDMRGRFPIGAGGTTSPSGTAIAATTKLTGGAIRYTYAATAAHTHTPGTFNASTSITEGTTNSSNHGHAVSGSVSANNQNEGYYVPNTGSFVTLAANQHIHPDNFTVNDSSTAGSHTHGVNAFTASTSITEPATTGGTTAANATIDVYPPYYSVSFIIYTGRV
jgi:microcystin-dependent protein